MAWRHMHGALGCRNGEAMVLGYLDNVLTVLGCSSEAVSPLLREDVSTPEKGRT